ncbi:MAG: ATP-binding protein [Pseudomonadota bacterium]|nr:ATP-binding protein [Pseudomonadota bacterium]
MFNRLLYIDPISRDSAFVFGPRGTGKTHWIKKHFPNDLYFDLLDSETYTDFLANPSRLADRIPSDYRGWIIIDEVQKVPALLDEAHRLIEHRELRFILTGSSARKLKQGGVNLLAGRALTYHMHPLTSLELGDEYDLARALQYGNLPRVVNHDNPSKFLASYVSTYLRQEVLQEGVTRNIGLFTRFLESASFSQGSILNYTEIAREVASNRHTINNFFDILEDLLIGYRLYPFTKHAKRNIVATPKFYYFDAGVYRSIRPKGPLDAPSEIDGPALETLFLQEARAINDYFDLGFEIFYWRTQSGQEVDFVLYGERGLFAFEIKRTQKIRSADTKSLEMFQLDYPMAKCFLLYGGTRYYTHINSSVMPFADGVKRLKVLLTGLSDN